MRLIQLQPIARCIIASFMETTLALKTKNGHSEVGDKDFRLFLQEELMARCRRNPKYSLRAFAKLLGIENSALSKILNGKRSVTPKKQAQIAKKLGLGPKELLQFAPVKRSRGIRDDDRKQDTVPLNYRQLTLDQFAVISDWYHYAILELTRIKGFRAEAKWISRALGISANEANVGIERLLRLEYLEKSNNGILINKSGNNSTVGNEFTAAAFKKLQAQVLEMAKLALEETSIEIRDQSSMTMAVNSKRLAEAKEKIKRFRRQICEFLETGGVLDEVYQLSVSLYPLTQLNKN